MRSVRISIFFLLVAGVAVAAEGPSFDCSKASGNAEELVCGDAALSEMDRRLAEVYDAALVVAEGLDAGVEEAVGTLKATQRGWIKGRDECWKAEDARACVEASYLVREAELVATWMLREPLAQARWICEGNSANEVYATYYDTPLPALRVEYGDGVEAMHLSRSASGARYEGTFGRMFWEKGGEARFVWTEGEEMSCTLAE